MKWLFWPLCLVGLMAAAEEHLVAVDQDIEIPVRVWPGEGRDLLLWLPSEYGISPRNDSFAEALADRGLTVWLADLHTAWFLAPGPRSLASVPPRALAALLQDALPRFQRVFVLAAGRTVPLALRMLRDRQVAGGDMSRIGGAVLLHPKLYRRTPVGGEEARFLPIALASNVPLYLVQPQLAAGHWRLPELMRALQRGGAPVAAQTVPEASDGFITRMDATPAERRAGDDFAAAFPGLLRLLVAYGPTPSRASPLPQPTGASESQRAGRLLQPVAQPFEAPPLELTDLSDGVHRLRDMRDSVVLVNFWATWCPPCVEEIPSLQRLFHGLRARGLRVLAVDVGEEPGQVREFLRERPVDFPVLLDPDGRMFRDWRIYAFPTSLVVDRRGLVRFAVYGAFQWDSAEVVRELEALLAE